MDAGGGPWLTIGRDGLRTLLRRSTAIDAKAANWCILQGQTPDSGDPVVRVWLLGAPKARPSGKLAALGRRWLYQK